MAAISTWSTTAASNNSVSPDGAPENMPPSGVNNTIRENMAQVRTERENTEWFDWGLTPTYISATSFSLAGDKTTEWHVGRRVKLTDASTLYATILTSAYTSLTTLTLTMDSGSVSASLTAAELGVMSSTNDSLPVGIGVEKLADGTVSDTEFQYISSLSSNAQTQITANASALTAHESDTSTHGVATVAGISETQTLTNKTLTTPVISTISNSGTVTLPTATDTLVARATTDTLTNKDLSSSTNTLITSGTFTPAISDALSNLPTYTTQVGTWSRIGDLVHVQGVVKLATIGDISSTEVLFLSGFPVASDSTANNVSTLNIGLCDNASITAGQSMSGYIQPSSAYAILSVWEAATGTNAAVGGDITGTFFIAFSAMYKA